MGVREAPEPFTKRLVLWPEGASPGRRAASLPSQVLPVHQAALGTPPGGTGPCAWGRPPLFVLRHVPAPCPDFTESF